MVATVASIVGEKSPFHSSSLLAHNIEFGEVMTPEAIGLLQQSIGKVVRITRRDREVIIAKIDLVDPLEEDIVSYHLHFPRR
jgi:hypothetical protein